MSRPRLRVAYDAGPYLNIRTGVGRYARELARRLELIGVEVKPYAIALRGRADGDIARWRAPARVVQASWRRYDMPSITRLSGPADLVHGTNFVLPALGGLPGVVTVHDLSFHRDDAFPGSKRLRDLVPWSIRRAARVIVPSATVGAEVAGRYGLAEDGIAVTPEAVAPVFFGAAPLGDSSLAALGIRRPFVVAVGTIEPRKNLPRLLAAWARAGDAVRDHTLVLAGPHGWGPELPETRGAVPIGWVGDETLPGLLAAADLFCYPSLYEGFGLPPLEAMAAGVPALVGRYPAAPEVLGDAAVLVDPNDVAALTEALVALLADDAWRARIARAGRARAAAYTWENTALETLKAYRAAVEH